MYVFKTACPPPPVGCSKPKGLKTVVTVHRDGSLSVSPAKCPKCGHKLPADYVPNKKMGSGGFTPSPRP